MTASSILHRIAGAPAMTEGVPVANAICWLCGRPCTRAVDRLRWEGANFCDQNKCHAASSPWVCEPCAWACSWVPPPGWTATRTDAKRTAMLRGFTHLWDAGEYLFCTKAEKPVIRAWLRRSKRGPWFAAIADSGQKHTLPWTPMNLSGGVRGVVRFEEHDTRIPDDAGSWRLLDDCTALLTAGATKDELGRGDYRVRTWGEIPDAVRDFEARWSHARHGRWFTLALWLAQREEMADGRRIGTTRYRAPAARAAQ